MTAIEIKIVLMNCSNKKPEDWEMELQKYVDKLLTPSGNPPKYIIFYQEGDQAKYSFLSQKMGYTVNYTEEGSGQTNGIIYHRSFKMTDAIEAIKMELYIPITVTTKYEKNTPPYFFMFDSHRFCLAIYSYSYSYLKSLLVSFHGPNIAKGLTNIEKTKNIEHYLTFFDRVRVAHGCQTMIVAGDFNITYSAIQSDCNALLEDLDLTVMEYNLGPEHHRSMQSGRGRNKEKVDTVIYSKSIAVVGNVAVDKDIPAEIMDHHPILVTLRLPTQAKMKQREQVLQL
jgi:hypothetical protein